MQKTERLPLLKLFPKTKGSTLCRRKGKKEKWEEYETRAAFLINLHWGSRKKSLEVKAHTQTSQPPTPTYIINFRTTRPAAARQLANNGLVLLLTETFFDLPGKLHATTRRVN